MRAGPIALLGALAVAPLAAAVDDAGRHASLGVGQASCHQFTTADEAAATGFKHYLLGYLTAYNTLAPDTYHATGRNTTPDNLRWLGDYCDAHPMESYERAIQQLVLARDAERLESDPRAATSWGRAPGTAPNAEAP